MDNRNSVAEEGHGEGPHVESLRHQAEGRRASRLDPGSEPERSGRTVAGTCALFDWGGTLMVDLPGCSGPMASWPRVEAVAHARDALQKLRVSGWRTALATNAADSDEAQIRAALARVGLDELIDRVYCSRAVGHAKPSPEFFSFIASDLGLEPAALVMVGDNFSVDIEGAVRSGICAVLLCPGAVDVRDAEKWRVIRSLAELPALLEAWPGR